jgi:hypothetical protein
VAERSRSALGSVHRSVRTGEDVWRLRKAMAIVKLLALAPGHCLHRERV